jgi:hypothetical protein
MQVTVRDKLCSVIISRYYNIFGFLLGLKRMHEETPTQKISPLGGRAL